jgi:hypothetical protein
MGFWKSLIEGQARHDAKRKAREAQAARVNAGKAFHRTEHNLSEADKLERAAARDEAIADRIKAQRIADANAGLSEAVRERVGLRPGEPATRVGKKRIKQAQAEIEAEQRERHDG